MAAAVDEAAQTDPPVSPFYPAVRVIAVRPAMIAALPTPSGHPGVARTFDAIVLTDRERQRITSLRLPHPQAVLAIGWPRRMQHLHTDYKRELVPLFVKVQKSGQGEN